MTTTVTPYTEAHEPLVQAMNARLAAAGSSWRFYEFARPRWLPAGASANVQRNYYVALDERGEVRGAYCLKPQTFWIRGQPRVVASLQGPISEGLIDPTHSLAALSMVRDMARRESLLMSWGGSARILEILRKLRWTSHSYPLLFRVMRPAAVLKSSPRLRRGPLRRALLDIAAASRAPDLAFAMAHSLIGLWHGGRANGAVRAYKVERFGPWADEIWRAALPVYAFIADRSADTLNALLPQDDWPEATILKIADAETPIGWAAVRTTRLAADPRLGDIHLGAIIDALALPGREADVIAAATAHLRARKVDVVVAMHTHKTWRTAFRRGGYMTLADQRPLLLAPQLGRVLAEGETDPTLIHMTLLDGDGPHGF